MPTIRQVLAVIRADETLGPNRKAFLIDQIGTYALKAQNQLDSKPKKIRAVKTGTQLLTLEQWEAARGKELHFTDFKDWIFKTGLIEFQVRLMIEEFRAEMQAKGKQYANFKMAFQTYLTKGYLSKKFRECLAERHETVIHTRGINL
jgi:hypothetical protein